MINNNKQMPLYQTSIQKEESLKHMTTAEDKKQDPLNVLITCIIGALIGFSAANPISVLLAENNSTLAWHIKILGIVIGVVAWMMYESYIYKPISHKIIAYFVILAFVNYIGLFNVVINLLILLPCKIFSVKLYEHQVLFWITTVLFLIFVLIAIFFITYGIKGLKRCKNIAEYLVNY